MNLYNKPRLTPRETQVLKLLSQEYSTKEIAKELYVSNSTIESHRRSLFLKMQVRNVAGLVRKAFEYGILKVESQFQNENIMIVKKII